MARRGVITSLYFIAVAISVFLVYLRISPPIARAGFQTLRQSGKASNNISLAKNEPEVASPADFDSWFQNFRIPKFKRNLSKTEMKHFVDILRRFDQLVSTANLTYFMYGGTLLGSYRHFGFIPWDDDIDLLVPHAQRDKILEVLSVPGYEVIQGVRWKFQKKSENLIKEGSRLRWPYLDITFYKEDANDIWDSDTKTFGHYKYRKDWVLPLTKRPFEGYWFNAPRNTRKCLENNIDLTMCVTGWWNHRHEHFVSETASQKCETLRPYYAFVERTILPGGKIKESLKKGSRVVEEVVFDH